MALIVGRYARAFADLVLDHKLDVQRTLDEVSAFSQVLEQSSELRRVWESPAIPVEQKRSLLDSLTKRMRAQQLVRNLVAVLIDQRRIAVVPHVARELERELNRRLGFSEAEILSARELSVEEKRALEKQIERLTGRKVRARYGRDESLIGGALVRVGSTVYDGSIRGQLQRLRTELSS
jgi:F-type H+-transporting ATPase subunit delta